MANRLLYLVRHGEQEGSGEVDEAGLSEVGRQQSRFLGERLRDVPFSALHHGPLRRAAQTAELIAEYLPAVPIHSSELVGDFIPSVPDSGVLSAPYAALFDDLPDPDRAEGARLAAAAIDRFAVPTEADQRELIVTHNFLIGWFVRHALDAPTWRWLGLNQYNCGLTIILYRHGLPSSLVSYNDVGHLPPALRGTGFASELRV